jgi:hypothetical protein
MSINFGLLLLLLLFATLRDAEGLAFSTRTNSPWSRESSAAPTVVLMDAGGGPHDDERKSHAASHALEPGGRNKGSATRREFGTAVIQKSMTMAVMTAAALVFPAASTFAAEQGGPVAVVIGANGRTGHECVKALRARGISCRACTRQGEYRDGSDLEGIESCKCDVTDVSAIEKAVNGASSVIFAASASKGGGTPAVVDNEGLVAVAKACISANVGQLVIVSSGAVTKPSSPVYLFLNAFGSIMSEKIHGEDAVRALYADGTPAHERGLSYTVVRPGGLTEEPSLDSVEGLELNQGDTKSGRISRADVANICVEALAYPELTGGTTLECYNADTGAPLGSVGMSNIFKQKTDSKDGGFVSGRECRGGTWKELFGGLEKD